MNQWMEGLFVSAFQIHFLGKFKKKDIFLLLHVQSGLCIRLFVPSLYWQNIVIQIFIGWTQITEQMEKRTNTALEQQ